MIYYHLIITNIIFQEFAESKQIFETKKRLGQLELEANLKKKLMAQYRMERSVPDEFDNDKFIVS